MKSMAIGLLLLSTFTIASAENEAQHLTLRATVRQVIPLASYQGKVIPADFDPRYALVLKIDAVTPAITNFTKDSTIVFAIHSPTRLFGAEPVKGQTCDFQIKRTIEDGKPKFQDLEIIRPGTK